MPYYEHEDDMNKILKLTTAGVKPVETESKIETNPEDQNPERERVQRMILKDLHINGVPVKNSQEVNDFINNSFTNNLQSIEQALTKNLNDACRIPKHFTVDAVSHPSKRYLVNPKFLPSGTGPLTPEEKERMGVDRVNAIQEEYIDRLRSQMMLDVILPSSNIFDDVKAGFWSNSAKVKSAFYPEFTSNDIVGNNRGVSPDVGAYQSKPLPRREREFARIYPPANEILRINMMVPNKQGVGEPLVINGHFALLNGLMMIISLDNPVVYPAEYALFWSRSTKGFDKAFDKMVHDIHTDKDAKEADEAKRIIAEAEKKASFDLRGTTKTAIQSLKKAVNKIRMTDLPVPPQRQPRAYTGRISRINMCVPLDHNANAYFPISGAWINDDRGRAIIVDSDTGDMYNANYWESWS